jgi:hypothetical protein
MSIKKLYSNYKDSKLREIQNLQIQVDGLISLSDDYYIAQRDAFNQQQKDEWNKKKETLQKYSEKYYEAIKSFLFDQKGLRHILLNNYYIIYEIYKFTGQELFSSLDIILTPEKINVPLDPKYIKLPDKPIPTTDLQPFKDNAKQKIQELQFEIEKLETELSEKISASQSNPIFIGYLIFNGNATEQWLYQDSVYDFNGGHSDDEKVLLILEFADKDRRKFERLKNKFSGEKSEELKYERTRIPEEVRIAVWRRDQGKCARCGNRENLEYDHIVPVSKGGGNTERNIELLCQDCNRAKGDRIE